MRMCRTIAPSAALLASLSVQALSVPAVAQEDPALVPASRLRFSADVAFTNSYYWRGFLQQDDTFIVQPGFALDVSLYEGDRGSMTLTLGNWNSFSESTSGSGDGIVGNWYEADFYACLTAQMDRWTLSASYIVYTSPNDSFTNVDELVFEAGFDDAGLFEDLPALNPSAVIAVELAGAADGRDEGVLLQLGIAPGYTFEGTAFGPVELTLPVSVGISLSDYYQDSNGDDDVFGHIDVGADAGFELPSPDGYGAWRLTAGVHVLFLGDNLEQINGGTSTELIGSVALSIAF